VTLVAAFKTRGVNARWGVNVAQLILYVCVWLKETCIRLSPAAYPYIYPYSNSTLRTVQSTMQNSAKQCLWVSFGWTAGVSLRGCHSWFHRIQVLLETRIILPLVHPNPKHLVIHDRRYLIFLQWINLIKWQNFYQS
jgi:hypothetical protein